MKYRRFGRTELRMPVFSCGGMRYQHKWTDELPEAIPADNQDNLERTIQRSLELGINHIETARGYGTSEMQLGRLLPRFPREELIVQTKIAPAETQREFLSNFDQSMKYLQLDHVDLLSMHGINNAELLDQTLRKNGSLEAARKMQRDGRAHFIGFSTHASPEVILEAVESGEFDYINVHWYFVNNFNWPIIEAARRRDMGVFIISPNDKGGMLYQPPRKLVNLCHPLSPIIFNDLYCLSRSEVHTLSVGAARPGDFDEHIAALEWYDDAAATIAPIEQRLRTAMDEALGRDWCETWWQALPEYYQVPGEVNVSEILRLWSLAKSLDLVEFARMRYNLMGNAGHWFPGKNAAALNLGAIREAVAQSPFADRIPQILREAHEMLVGEERQRLSQSD